MAAVLLGGIALVAGPGSPAAASTPHAAWATFITLKDTGPSLDRFDVAGVSCVSAGNCTAVGNDWINALQSTITSAYHWNGTTWAQTQIQVSEPVGVPHILNGVSCASTQLCMAVGYFLA
jgi:hypothetical protein